MDRPGVVDHEPDPRFEPATRRRREPAPILRRRAWLRPASPGLGDLVRKLAAPLVVLGVLLVKFGGLLLKLKVFTTAGLDARLDRRVRLDLGAAVRGRVRAPDLRRTSSATSLELRRQGVPASAPLFIPFLGAVIGMKELPDDAWKEARVALAGPILGSVGAAVCWSPAEATGSELLMALAFVGFFLNLFNLIPIVPLDGGARSARCIRRSGSSGC